MNRLAAPLFVLLAALSAAACDTVPDYLKEDIRERRLSEAGVEAFDTTGTYKLAGMSALREVDIEAVDLRDLGGDTLGPDFLAFHARCSACHVAPAPSSKPAHAWSSVMSRMVHNQEQAGLMPMRQEDEARVLRFLERHGRTR